MLSKKSKKIYKFLQSNIIGKENYAQYLKFKTCSESSNFKLF